jgi:hypothetical protein
VGAEGKNRDGVLPGRKAWKDAFALGDDVRRSPGVGAIGHDPAPPPGATGLKVAVEVADDYVPAGSPRRPSMAWHVCRILWHVCRVLKWSGVA